MAAHEIRRWRRRRRMYGALLVLLFAAVAFYVGPNLILFGKPTWIAPADFVPVVERECVQIVRAMKAYQRDHGRLPDRMKDLIPAYLPGEYDSISAAVSEGQFQCGTAFNHKIRYDFHSEDENWSVSGAFTRGRIPYPPVTLPPELGPTTRPAAAE